MLLLSFWRGLGVRMVFHISMDTEGASRGRSHLKREHSSGPVTHTRILCSSQWSGVSLWWALYNSFPVPPGPYYPGDSKATCSHQQLCDSYLSNRLHRVPINNKGPATLSVPLPFISFFLSFFLCSEPVYILSPRVFLIVHYHSNISAATLQTGDTDEHQRSF